MGTYSGYITNGSFGVQLTKALQNPVTVTSTGTISGTTEAIYGSNITAWRIFNHGKVTGGNYSVTLAGAGTVTNYGTVSATAVAGVGVAFKEGGTVVNKSGAAILALEGEAAGVVISGATGTVSNDGTIQGNQAGVILGSGGAVENAKSSLIEGGNYSVTLSGAGTVTNYGTISATAATGLGVGLTLGGSVVNKSGASITGGGGVYISGGTGTVSNDGKVQAVNIGIILGSGGRIGNGASGLIKGGNGGIYLDGGLGTVENYGTITGFRPVWSFGTATGPVTVTNGNSGSTTALISGVAGGVLGEAGGAVTNFGTISATGGPGVGLYGTGNAVTSYGAIEALSGERGVYLSSGGSVTNGGGGFTKALIRGGSGIGINGSPGTVANFGTIEGTGTASPGYGVSLLYGGNLVNGSTAATAASIAGYIGAAFSALAEASSVANYGTISGTVYGVYLDSGGSVKNGASGATAALIEASTGVAIWIARDPGTATNYGTIKGGIGIDLGLAGSSTLINHGTIIGTGGEAALFGGSNDRLVVTPGAIFTGTVNGGGGTALELAKGAGTGTLSGLGTNFLNFGPLIFDSSAAWTVTFTSLTGFTGTISGFVKGDILDLIDTAATSNTYSSGKLTVLDGSTTVVTFNFLGTYTSSEFVLSSDDHSGTDITIGATAAPFGLALAAGSDSGVKGDDITNVTKPVITGDGVAGDTVTLYDGTKAIGTAVVVAGGTWSVTATSALAAGAHALTATESNAVSGTSAASAALKLTIKTSAPAPSGLSFAVAADKGTSGDTFTVAGKGEVKDTVTLYDGTTAIGSAIVAASGAWSITTASPLKIGAHSLSVHEVDIAANTSPLSPAQSVTIDSATPYNDVVFVGNPGPDNFTGGAGNDIFEFSAANLASTDSIKGGAGSNELLMTTAGTVSAGGVSAVETYQLANGAANSLTLSNANFGGVTSDLITVDGGANGNTVNASALSAANHVFIHGNAGADVLKGGAGNDTFELTPATLATATITGGGGNDTLIVNGAGTVAIGGVSGVGTIDLGNGASNMLALTNGNFAGLTGGTITVDGGNDGNTVNASALTGANRIIAVGGAGKDVFTGGAGNDIFKFSVANLTAADTVNGGGGSNELLMTTTGTVAAAGVAAVQTIVLANGGANTLTLTSANFTPGEGITIFDGNKGNTVSAASLLGGQGHIIVHAGAGADTLTGGGGNDTFYAGGDTTMTGGAGTNVFAFSAAGNNMIKDFAVSATNEIAFSNGGFALGQSGATSTPKALPAGLFVADSTGTFTAATQRLAYGTSNGDLYYSASGTTATEHLVTTLTGHPTIAASHLFFIT